MHPLSLLHPNRPQHPKHPLYRTPMHPRIHRRRRPFRRKPTLPTPNPSTRTKRKTNQCKYLSSRNRFQRQRLHQGSTRICSKGLQCQHHRNNLYNRTHLMQLTPSTIHPHLPTRHLHPNRQPTPPNHYSNNPRREGRQHPIKRSPKPRRRHPSMPHLQQEDHAKPTM